MNFKFDLQLFGGGGTQVNERELTPEERQLIGQQASYIDKLQPAIQQLVSTGTGLLGNVIQPNYQSLYNDAKTNVANAQAGINQLATGQLPSAYTANKQAYYNQLYNNSFGSTLANKARSGVINSSVMAKANDGIQKNTTAQMSADYNKDIATQSGLLQQQMEAANAGINAANLANASSFGNASQYLSLASGQGSQGNQTLAAIGNLNNGRTYVTQDQGFLGGLMGGMGAYFGAK